jgi:hypothetical protein
MLRTAVCNKSVLFHLYLKMEDLKEQLVWKLFLRQGKNATETFKLLKIAFGEQTMWRTQVSSDFPSEWDNLSWRRPNPQKSTDEQNRGQDGRNEGTASPKQKSLSMKLLVSWKFHLGLFRVSWKISLPSIRLPHVSPLNEQNYFWR